jgi:hypothetical protein
MRKWFEYQLEKIVDNKDWSISYKPITNFGNEFDIDFEQIKEFYYAWRSQQSFHTPKVAISNRLVGAENYAKYISDFYDDEYIASHIQEWCRDKNYLTLIDQPSVDRVDLLKHFPNISEKLCKRLNVTYDYCQITCQVQPPGYISPLHIDSRKTIYPKEGEKFDPRQTPDHSRWIIFMEDWQPGQAFEMGFKYIKWKKGDVFFWDTKDVPHALANMGYWDRFLILIYARSLDQ